jgi:hypothetical protein
VAGNTVSAAQLRSIPPPGELAVLRSRVFLRRRGLDVGPDSVAAILGLPWRES